MGKWSNGWKRSVTNNTRPDEAATDGASNEVVTFVVMHVILAAN
jgi:hypothetical protein